MGDFFPWFFFFILNYKYIDFLLQKLIFFILSHLRFMNFFFFGGRVEGSWRRKSRWVRKCKFLFFLPSVLLKKSQWNFENFLFFFVLNLIVLSGNQKFEPSSKLSCLQQISTLKFFFLFIFIFLAHSLDANFFSYKKNWFLSTFLNGLRSVFFFRCFDSLEDSS